MEMNEEARSTDSARGKSGGGHKRELILVDASGMERLNARPSLRAYIGQLRERRDFVRSEGETRSLSAGRDMYLGRAWLILDPLFQVAVYALVFGLILRASRGIDNYIGFLVIGVIFFGFFSKSVNASTNLFKNSRQLINSFSFPRAAIPIASCYRQFIDNAFPAAVAVLVALVWQAGENLSFSILLVLPLYIVYHFFLLGLSFFVSPAVFLVPDLKPIFSLLSRGLFFLSGVFYSIDRFEFNERLGSVMQANPIYQFLLSFRNIVLEGSTPDLATWSYLGAWTALLFVFGFLMFWSMEDRYNGLR